VHLLRAAVYVGVLFVVAAAPACSGCGHEAASLPDASSVGVPVSGDDRAQAIQALLDSPWVQNALQPEGNSPPPPLVMVAPPGLEGATLRAFGQPVKVLTPAQVQAQRPESFFEVTQLKLDGDRAGLSFRAEAEGVSGEAILERAQGRWRVAKVTGTEH
jgi:hypothetical protein